MRKPIEIHKNLLSGGDWLRTSIYLIGQREVATFPHSLKLGNVQFCDFFRGEIPQEEKCNIEFAFFRYWIHILTVTKDRVWSDAWFVQFSVQIRSNLKLVSYAQNADPHFHRRRNFQLQCKWDPNVHFISWGGFSHNFWIFPAHSVSPIVCNPQGALLIMEL